MRGERKEPLKELTAQGIGGVKHMETFGNRIMARLVRGTAILTACVGSALCGTADARPPNIVLLVADDLGSHDLGCDGHSSHQTPVLDALAASGLHFTAAYAAASVCSPSRAALLTGQHPARLNLTTFLPGRSDRGSHKLLSPPISPQLPDGVRTLAELLAPVGYRSHHVGKWHLGGPGALPTDHGFASAAPGNANPGPESTEGGKGEFRQADAAVRIIGEQCRMHADEPFLLVVGFDSPHVPLAAPAAAVAAHATAFNPTYAAMMAALDAAVGRILTAIDDHGIADRTLVAFTSDNGGLHVPEAGDPPPTTNMPCRAGKGFLYEGGIRVPLLIRLPGSVQAGRTIDAPVSTGDLAPTLCTLSGAAFPSPGDFHDLGSLLNGMQTPPYPLYWHQPHSTNQGGRPAGAIRDDDWKLIEHFEDGSLELFHLRDDPGETRDCAADAPDRVAELRGKLEAWRREVGARSMTANPRFDAYLWAACHRSSDVSRLAPAATAAEMVTALAAWRRAMDDTAEGPPASRQGFLLLRAADASVRGEKLLYEPQPHKDTLGYWVNADDVAWWDVSLPEMGRYRVTVLQGCGAGQGGSTVEMSAGGGGEPLRFTVEETGHFQRFVPRDVGELTIPAGDARILVRAVAKKAAAVMDLRQVMLERLD